MNKNQIYHLEPPYGFMNDPNAFLYYKDQYYLFFQWNPIDKNHGHKDWGYFTSKDLINWDFNGQAIRSGSYYDKNGVYSGTGVIYKGNIYLYYTGNVKLAGVRKSFQNLVTSTDGQEFIKEGFLFTTPAGFTEHIRDPKVFIHDNTFYMLLAAQEVTGFGSIILFKSPNPKNFRFEKVIARTDEFEMVECPDIAFFEDKALLNYALQHRDNKNDKSLDTYSFYKVVEFDFKTDQLSSSNLDQDKRLIDEGFDFYVPQTLKLEDGRTLMVAWMSSMTEEQSIVFAKNSFKLHCMTMFREISLDGDKLIQKPIKEYKKLLSDELKQEENRLYCDSRHWRIKVNFEDQDNFTLKFNNEVKIEYNKDSKTFKLSRKSWVKPEWESKEIKLESLNELEIWSDTSSIELYLNKGKTTMSSRINPEKIDSQIKISTEGTYNIKANQLKYF